MLTHDQIKAAARLMQQVGELRPGYIRETEAHLGGPLQHLAHGQQLPLAEGVASHTDQDTVIVELVVRRDADGAVTAVHVE